MTYTPRAGRIPLEPQSSITENLPQCERRLPSEQYQCSQNHNPLKLYRQQRKVLKYLRGS